MAFRRNSFSRYLFAARAFHSSTTPLSPASPSLIHGIHVFHCPDVVGIVAKLSECIALRGANIHFVDVFVPENKHVFYSRRSKPYLSMKLDAHFNKDIYGRQGVKKGGSQACTGDHIFIATSCRPPLRRHSGLCCRAPAWAFAPVTIPSHSFSLRWLPPQGVVPAISLAVPTSTAGHRAGLFCGALRKQSGLISKKVLQLHSEFVFDPARWPRDVMVNDFMNIGKLFNAKRSVVRVPDVDPKFKIALLASKQDHCLVDVLHGWQDGWLPVDINCVISNHDRAPNTHVIRFLERHGIPYYYLPTTPENNREEDMLDLVKDTDFLVLARYMQILSFSFLESYGKDIINIHHGLLPSFTGSNPARQAYTAGVKLIGATTHFVTPELDAGPIIEQMVERVSHKDTLQSFVQKSENLEKQCLRKAIQSYCELRVLPYEGKKTLVF